MNNLLKTNIGYYRIIGFLEGVSFILLMFIAMPLKYILNQPIAVQIIGMAHGILFILFVFYTLYLSLQRRWSFIKITAPLLLSSVLPFGTFIADRKIISRLS